MDPQTQLQCWFHQGLHMTLWALPTHLIVATIWQPVSIFFWTGEYPNSLRQTWRSIWQSRALNWIHLLSRRGYPKINLTTLPACWMIGYEKNTVSRRIWNHLLVICTILPKWSRSGWLIFWQPAEGMTIPFILTATFTRTSLAGGISFTPGMVPASSFSLSGYHYLIFRRILYWLPFYHCDH